MIVMFVELLSVSEVALVGVSETTSGDGVTTSDRVLVVLMVTDSALWVRL